MRHRDNDAALLAELADSDLVEPGSMMQARLREIAGRLEALSPDDELAAHLERRLGKWLRDQDDYWTSESAQAVVQHLILREVRGLRHAQQLNAVMPAMGPLLARLVGSAFPVGTPDDDDKTGFVYEEDDDPPEEDEGLPALWLARSANSDGHDLFVGRPEGPNEYGDYTGHVVAHDVDPTKFGVSAAARLPIRIHAWPDQG